METGRNVMHYALGDNQDYEHEWSKAVLEYLENGYSSEDSKSEVEVGNTTYKILKREKVTAFYDADGNTLFDIENDRLKEEYEAMDFSASEPQSEMGKAISNIEQQAFEQAVNDDIDADDTIPMGTASLAFGIEVDQKSVGAAENAIKGVKNMASKLLGAIGIGFSIAGIANLAEAAADAEALKSQFSQVFGDLEQDASDNPVNVGDVVVYDKQVNGFKIAFTGSAKSVTVRCFVQGGGTV